MNDFYKPLDGKKQLEEMMNNTTNAAKRPSGLRACADGLDVNPDKDFAQKCMRYAADRMEQLERGLAAVTEQRDRLAVALREGLERLEHHTEFGALVQADMSAMHSSREALQSLTPKDHE
jgi:hypothetical protein